MLKKIFVLLSLLITNISLQAGSITIEKRDSLIRNDLFEEKRVRAEEYLQYETQRKANNRDWTSQIDASCGLLKNRYLIYFCASNNRYYKGYESGEQLQYRQLSELEIKKMANEND